MMAKKIFYADRFVRYSAIIFECLQQIVSRNKDYEIIFLGPDDKNIHFLSNQQISNAKKVWTPGHYVRKIYKYIKNHKPDLIHFSFELRTFGTVKSAIRFPLLLYLISRTRTKIVVTLHNILIFKKKSEWTVVEDLHFKIPKFLLINLVRLFIKTICKFSNEIVVTTHANKVGLAEFYGVNIKKIKVIPEGFSTEEKPINLQKKEKFLKQFNNKKIILAFGVITPRKGLVNIINAFRKINEGLPNHILVIGGRTNPDFNFYENMLHQLSKNLNLDKKIFFTGFVDNDEVEILFDVAEITLYVYHPSPAGTGALSYAIQHGKPAIVSKTDTFKEVLGENEALFVDPDDEKQLADTILELATNKNLRSQLQQKIKAIVDRRSWNEVAHDHLNLYEKILA